MHRALEAAFAVTLLILPGCVTTHVGDEVAGASDKYSLSCAPYSAVSTKYFRMVSCTIENKSDDWLTFKATKADPQPATSLVAVASPQDVDDYQRAFAFKAAKDEANRALWLGTTAIAGSALAIDGMAERNHDLALVGVGALGSAAGAATFDQVSHGVAQAQYGELAYAGDHLLGTPVRVPPGLFVRKYLLLEVKPDAAAPETLHVCTEKPEKQCMDVPVQFPRWRSDEAN